MLQVDAERRSIFAYIFISYLHDRKLKRPWCWAKFMHFTLKSKARNHLSVKKIETKPILIILKT